MMRLRFNIGTLLAVVVFLAVAFAALREATAPWESGVFTLTVAMLLAGVLLSVHRTGRGRAFWIGFALFGWTYLAAGLIPWIEPRLLTTKGLEFLDSKIPGRAVTFSVTLTANNSGTPSNPVAHVLSSPIRGAVIETKNGPIAWSALTGKALAGPFGSPENFVRIGHSLLAPVVALCGGQFSRRLFLKAPGLDGTLNKSVRVDS
jgi:hypothetical protein